jgi:hypothetical protein
MLTISEESGTYPPDGKLPDLDNDEAAYVAVEQRVGTRGDITPDVWAKLVAWSCDKASRTYLTWQAAIVAAADEVDVEQERRKAAATTPGHMAAREADDQIGARLGQVAPQVERARKFSNCGQTVILVLEGLEPSIPALAPLRQNSAPVTINQANRGNLQALLTHLPVLGQVSLIDCTFPAVHTFLIEAHHDGRRYLIQGYQGVYVASWWQGTEDAGLVLAPLNRGVADWQTKYDATKNSLRAVRNRFGNRTAIAQHDWNAFVTNLTTAFAGGDWASFAIEWLNLPFAPTTGESESISKRGDIPTLQIATFDVPHPNPGLLTSICAPEVPNDVMTYITN